MGIRGAFLPGLPEFIVDVMVKLDGVIKGRGRTSEGAETVKDCRGIVSARRVRGFGCLALAVGLAADELKVVKNAALRTVMIVCRAFSLSVLSGVAMAWLATVAAWRRRLRLVPG